MPIEATIKTSGALGAKLAAMAAGLTSATELRVGFMSGKGANGGTYPDGTSVALVAAVMNYGSGKTPPRPFFDRMVAENESGWPELIAIGLKRFNNDAKKALEFAGKIMEEQLVTSIQSGDYAPDAPVTNLLKQRFPTGIYEFKDFLQAVDDVAKGADAPAGKPLVWSGNLARGVASEVT